MNNEPSVFPTILPEGDSSKVVVDKTMSAAILIKIEHNIISKETAEIVAAFLTIICLEE